VTVSISSESYPSRRLELDRRFGGVYIPSPGSMDATRARVSSLFEWLVALACILAVVAIGSVLMRDIGNVTAIAPVIANEETLPDPPATVPPRSVSVPVVLLADGSELRVGDTADVLMHIGAGAEVAPPTIDRTALGERVTRFYAQQNGQRFTVVLQPLAPDGEVRVTAIYLPAAR